MKKKLAMLMAATMVFGLTACGSSDDSAAKDDTAKTDDAAKDDAAADDAADSDAAASDGEFKADVNGDGKIIVGYISKNLTDPFHGPINESGTQKLDALVDEGVIDEWTGILDGNTDGPTQINCAQDCISKGCDYVIILPAEAEASDPAVVQMAEAGIHVVVVNSKTNSTDDLAMLYSGSDDVQAGEMMGNYIIEKCPDGGKYVHCNGILGNSAQIQRTEGIANTLGANEKFEMVADEDTQWKGDLAANAATNAMAQYGDELVAIVCDNDDMSSAAQTACNSNGRSDIFCIGVDGNQTPLQMIKDGELGATVYQDGVGQLGAAIDAIVESINSGSAPAEKEIMVDFVLVTSENVDEYLQ
ncbi:MAG TPA: substrate-binding domain-containing protein [Candidatus Egerieimonas intestinavium]|uniref:Substrate-binding domain-containing protein n=1 Tax=Candidatus Egerieimonas intestinavium TaxID=2840777 RepID=A0A9D1JEW6_9FIRM|nr:substrate-binding domain-containing protein [Candidatus Egerieimonas intestinavium]